MAPRCRPSGTILGPPGGGGGQGGIPWVVGTGGPVHNSGRVMPPPEMPCTPQCRALGADCTDATADESCWTARVAVGRGWGVWGDGGGGGSVGDSVPLLSVALHGRGGQVTAGLCSKGGDASRLSCGAGGPFCPNASISQPLSTASEAPPATAVAGAHETPFRPPPPVPQGRGWRFDPRGGGSS